MFFRDNLPIAKILSLFLSSCFPDENRLPDETPPPRSSVLAWWFASGCGGRGFAPARGPGRGCRFGRCGRRRRGNHGGPFRRDRFAPIAATFHTRLLPPGRHRPTAIARDRACR